MLPICFAWIVLRRSIVFYHLLFILGRCPLHIVSIGDIAYANSMLEFQNCSSTKEMTRGYVLLLSSMLTSFYQPPSSSGHYPPAARCGAHCPYRHLSHARACICSSLCRYAVLRARLRPLDLSDILGEAEPSKPYTDVDVVEEDGREVAADA